MGLHYQGYDSSGIAPGNADFHPQIQTLGTIPEVFGQFSLLAE
jgi:hypothetical protein